MTTSREEAQRHADEIQAFRVEIARLETNGTLTLTAAQRQAMGEYHERLLRDYAAAFDIDTNRQARQLSLGMRITSFLGALALAASVFFLFYQFWGLLPTVAQVVLLILAPVATFGGTLLIQRRDASGYFTKLAALVAFSCFVLNVVMLGQIFNIAPSDSALMPWAAFALLLAYAFDLRLLLVAGILCLVAYVAARVGSWGGFYWLSLGERPEHFFLAALVLFAIPALFSHRSLPGFAATYRITALLTLFLPMLVLAHWGSASYLPWSSALIEGFYQVLGFTGTAVAAWLGIRRDLPDVVNTSVALFVILLYTKFFDWWWTIMPKSLFFLVLALVAILILLVLRRLRASGHAGAADQEIAA